MRLASPGPLNITRLVVVYLDTFTLRTARHRTVSNCPEVTRTRMPHGLALRTIEVDQ
jgi:hypothetical protein